MKHFLITFIIGMTSIAIGFTMIFFEIKDYKEVNGCDLYNPEYYTTTNTFDVSDKDLNITLEDGFIRYDIIIDESMKDKVKVETSEAVLTEVSDNRLYVRESDLHSYQNYNYREDLLDLFHKVIDGLKEHKIYTCESNEVVRITCSKEMRNRIKMKMND